MAVRNWNEARKPGDAFAAALFNPERSATAMRSRQALFNPEPSPTATAMRLQQALLNPEPSPSVTATRSRQSLFNPERSATAMP
jgi:hypothetical protein